jgi:excisionase family DNA binding protein
MNKGAHADAHQNGDLSAFEASETAGTSKRSATAAAKGAAAAKPPERRRRAAALSDLPRLGFKVSEAAKLLGVHKTAMYDLIRDGRISYSRLAGGCIMIGREAIEAFLRGESAA